jgi:hypothetical protein
MSVPIPQISVDGMSTLKPELIGLAAWLSATRSNLLVSDRRKILEHVGEHGTLGKELPCPMSQEEVAAANAAHSDWQDFLAAIAVSPVRPLLPSLHRNGNHFIKPICGGSEEAGPCEHADYWRKAMPVLDAALVNAAEEMVGDDIDF